jgi:hypothetical protein
MKRKALVIIPLIAALALSPSIAEPAPPSAVAAMTASTGFENGTANAPFTLANFAAQGFAAPSEVGLDERSFVHTSIVHGGAKSLRITFPQGAYGDPAATGAHASFAIPSSRSYWISQWVRFDSNFSWGGTKQGGKVGFGLVGGDGCSGGQTCNGTNGFSSRVIWRAGGGAALYLYHMDKPGAYGEELPLKTSSGANIVFPKGQWINLVIRVTTNTVTNGVAASNGEVQVWYNGQSALYRSGLRYVTNSDQVDTAVLSTFPGGAEAAYAPLNDSYLWIDDVKVSTNSADICELSSC